jgi:hypothetical protein
MAKKYLTAADIGPQVQDVWDQDSGWYKTGPAYEYGFLSEPSNWIPYAKALGYTGPFYNAVPSSNPEAEGGTDSVIAPEFTGFIKKAQAAGYDLAAQADQINKRKVAFGLLTPDGSLQGEQIRGSGSVFEKLAPMVLMALGANYLAPGMAGGAEAAGAAAAGGGAGSTVGITGAEAAAMGAFDAAAAAPAAVNALAAPAVNTLAAPATAQLTPAALEAAIGTPGYGYNAAAAASGITPSAGFAGMSAAEFGMSGAQTTAYDTAMAAGAAPEAAAAAANAAPGIGAPGATAATAAAANAAATGATAVNPFSFIIPAASSLIGGVMSANAAENAAEASGAAATRAAELQRESAREALALQERMYRESVERQQPYYQAGTNALAQMRGQTNAMPEAFQYGGNIPTLDYAGQVPGAFQYAGQQPTFNYSGQQPEAFKFRAEDLQTDPGYGFRLSEGLKALERSAAARGGLLSGGTGKALTRYGQEMGSQEFGNAFNRSLTQYNAAAQREQQQYGRALTGFDISRQQEAEQYGRGLTGYGMERQREADVYGRSLTGLQLGRAAEAEQYNRSLTGYNALRQREADQYNRLAGLAGIGGTTAQQLTAAGQGYGTQASNLLTGTAANVGNLMAGQGQTAANALLAQGSAYQRSAGDIASLYARMYGPQPTYLMPGGGG